MQQFHDFYSFANFSYLQKKGILCILHHGSSHKVVPFKNLRIKKSLPRLKLFVPSKDYFSQEKQNCFDYICKRHFCLFRTTNFNASLISSVPHCANCKVEGSQKLAKHPQFHTNHLHQNLLKNQCCCKTQVQSDLSIGVIKIFSIVKAIHLSISIKIIPFFKS